MLKTIVPLLIGATASVAATVYVAGRLGTATDIVAVGDSSTGASSTSRPAIAGDRYREAYREAGQISNPRDVEARLLMLLTEPFSLERDAEISALFERLAALDLKRALAVAETPGFDFGLVAEVIRALGEVDPEAALKALAAVRNPTLQVRLAVALLATFGNDAASLERIAAALPESQRVVLQAEALGELAKTDPAGAMSTALGLGDPNARTASAQRVGVEWVHSNPVAAFEMRNSLPVEIREPYRDEVAVEWARLDSRDFLAYADTQPMLNDMLMGLMHTISVDPERTFEVASTHPPLTIAGPFAAYVTVERTAFANAAGLDPERYLALLEAMPDGQRKQQLTPAFVEVYARVRPDEALAWAQTQGPNALNYQVRVIREIAVLDHDRAYRLMRDFYERTGNLAAAQSIATNVGSYAATDARRAEIATGMLEQTDDPLAQTVVNRMLQQWVQSEPETALDWMLSNGSSVDAAMASNIAGRLAQRDAKLAASYIERMPPELRGAWLQQVAAPYAQQDPEGAAAWLTQYQGEPGYDAMFQRLIQQTAQTDPQGATVLLAAMPAAQQPQVVASIANGLARNDLAAAAQWAAGVKDESARQRAVSSVATVWARRDPRAAQRWAAGLPEGPARDRALQGVISRLSYNGYDVAIDASLFDDFDSAELRQQTLTQALRSLATEDPERARSLLDDWVDDPALRQRLEPEIDQASENRGGIVIF